MKYWFKPARFWKWFAAYYPSSWQGWLITILLLIFGTYIFCSIDARSHSVSDTLIAFSPWVIALGLLFDMFCFRTGEYPKWWRRRE